MSTAGLEPTAVEVVVTSTRSSVAVARLPSAFSWLSGSVAAVNLATLA